MMQDMQQFIKFYQQLWICGKALAPAMRCPAIQNVLRTESEELRSKETIVFEVEAKGMPRGQSTGI